MMRPRLRRRARAAGSTGSRPLPERRSSREAFSNISANCAKSSGSRSVTVSFPQALQVDRVADLKRLVDAAVLLGRPLEPVAGHALARCRQRHVVDVEGAL